jgi:hypothetical protein
VSIRSDGSVFSKLKVKFKPDSFNPNGWWHSCGWKKSIGTTEARKRRLTAEGVRDVYLKNCYTLIASA